MSNLFDFEGPNLDLGFQNLKAGESSIERELHDLIESMWVSYEPYADPDFPQGFARDVDGRCWEMYLGCTLLDASRTLLPVVERQRDGDIEWSTIWENSVLSSVTHLRMEEQKA